MYYFFKTVLVFVSLFNANLSATITETPSVYSEVGSEFFNTMYVDIILQLFNTQVLPANCSSCVAVNVARSRILPTLHSVIYYSRNVGYLFAGCLYNVGGCDEFSFFLRLEKRPPTNTFIFWSVRCCWCAVPFLLIQRYRERSHRNCWLPGLGVAQPPRVPPDSLLNVGRLGWYRRILVRYHLLQHALRTGNDPLCCIWSSFSFQNWTTF